MSDIERGHQVQDFAVAGAKQISPKLAQLSKSEQYTLISSLLLAIDNFQKEAGVHDESPAILFDNSKNEIVSISAASSTWRTDLSSPSTIDCLQRACKSLGVFQLDELPVSLHVIGSPSFFEASGAVYLSAPQTVVFTEREDQKYSGSAIHESYWREAKKERGTSYSIAPKTDRLTGIEQPELQEHPRKNHGKNHRQNHRTSDESLFHDYFERWEKETFLVNSVQSSSSEKMSPEILTKLMDDLHELAYSSVCEGGGPFAAAVIDPDGKLLSFGVNQVVKSLDAIGHGERAAISSALRKANRSELEGFILVSSSFTCISCAEQASLARIQTVLYDNSRAEVESQTPFTEGPIHPQFSSMTGVEFLQVRSPSEELRSKAFQEFQSQVERDPSRSYLSSPTRTVD